MYLSVSSMKAEWLEFSFKGNPFGVLDFDEERLYHKILRDIFAAISDKCGDAYETQTIDNWPILQYARGKWESV